MKIFTIVGARPQFIKAATVSRQIQLNPDLTEVLVHTGQHYDRNLSDIFFEELDLYKPHYNLGIGSGSHGQQTGRMLEEIESTLLEEKPDWVLVYGDTNSTLAGALAASKLHIPIAHIEAGLRSFNWQMPEEINRILTDRISTLLFAPTTLAVENLQKEGRSLDDIFDVGDVMYDTLLYYQQKAKQISSILKTLNLEPKKYILATIHRAENTDSLVRFKNIIEALQEVSKTLPVILPLHPRTSKILQNYDIDSKSLKIIEPVGYLDMVMLEHYASLICTDSGGVQKESFFHQVPCVTLRDETEWTELVDLGWNIVISPNNTSKIIHQKILSRIGCQGILAAFPYGQGRSADAIVYTLSKLAE